MVGDHSSPSERSVKNYIDFLDNEELLESCHVLIDMMKKISSQEPILWNVGTIAFDTYHYKYDSGREGEVHIIGFYPRKGKITIYLMDGTARHSELLAKLGRHTSTKYCVYLRRLSDIDLLTLEKILKNSYEYIKSQDGRIHEIVWRTAQT
jgi:hypothetical protein